ncbi:MAG: hypothetical protein LBE09_04900 [Christensenellaceae bacterium]|jgi:hypothetical protein|nr:hypothetical protein [Christensenellaceae bacterium]
MSIIEEQVIAQIIGNIPPFDYSKIIPTTHNPAAHIGIDTECLFCGFYCGVNNCIDKEARLHELVKPRIIRHIEGCLSATDPKEKLWNALRARKYYTTIVFDEPEHHIIKKNHIRQLFDYIVVVATQILGTKPMCDYNPLDGFIYVPHKHCISCVINSLTSKYNRNFNPPVSRNRRLEDGSIVMLEEADYDDSEYDPNIHVKEDAANNVVVSNSEIENFYKTILEEETKPHAPQSPVTQSPVTQHTALWPPTTQHPTNESVFLPFRDSPL